MSVLQAPEGGTVGDLTDVTYEVDAGLATITINRPERLNSFRAHTVDELITCLKRAWSSADVGVVPHGRG
jgi:1,4-dihydroxy-2-naphthoyl-CoA synthase